MCVANCQRSHICFYSVLICHILNLYRNCTNFKTRVFLRFILTQPTSGSMDSETDGQVDLLELNISNEDDTTSTKPLLDNEELKDADNTNQQTDVDPQEEVKVDTVSLNAPNQNISKVGGNKSIGTLKKSLTFYSKLDETNEELPLPYDNTCASKLKYYFDTFLVVNPRIYAIYLLYSATWPRGLVILDMYTDVQVALSLYNNGESFWFMLSSMFIVLPFVLVWTVSLRFIQRFINNLYSQSKYNTKCMSTLINIALSLYIFPPIGSLFVALYEVYLVVYDIFNGFRSFILGTGLVETQTPDVVAMKQYRRAVEIFAESVPQTLLQLYMFIRNVAVDQNDLYLSLAISGFNLIVNAYKFRKEAKMLS